MKIFGFAVHFYAQGAHAFAAHEATGDGIALAVETWERQLCARRKGIVWRPE
jgi:hypothetical protein